MANDKGGSYVDKMKRWRSTTQQTAKNAEKTEGSIEKMQPQLNDVYIRVHDIQDRAYDILAMVRTTGSRRYTDGHIEDPNADFLVQNKLSDIYYADPHDAKTPVSQLKVSRRAANLGVRFEDFLRPEERIAEIRETVSAATAGTGKGKTVDFAGTRTSELNALMGGTDALTINITSTRIEADECIKLRSNISLAGNGARITAGKDLKYIILGDGCSDISVSGLELCGGNHGLYLSGSNNVRIEGNTIHAVGNRPFTIVSGGNIYVADNNIFDNAWGGMYITKNAANCVIEKNNVHDNHGTSNIAAGITMTAKPVDHPLDFTEDLDETQRLCKAATAALEDLTDAPCNIVVANNNVSRNNSSGIYNDGAYLIYVIDNIVRGNDKEGMCFDYGAIASYICGNYVEGNGTRSRQTDKDLQLDFIWDFGRLPDGSAAAKLPGISLDNTMWNIIVKNTVKGNSGSGIKAVRTAAENIILENAVIDNNEGRSDVFHFFGIELGANMVSDHDGDTFLDYAPDYGNIVTRNVVTGRHYAGIFLAEKCRGNEIRDNTVVDYLHLTVEDISASRNTII